MAYEEYKVAGYGERNDYDGPYHATADFDPADKFKHAGDVVAADKKVKAEHAASVKAVSSKEKKDA